MALNDQDIAMIMSAIAETPQFQFLNQLMAADQAGDDGLGEAPMDEGGMDPGMEPGMEPGMDEGMPPEAMPDDMGGEPPVDDGGDMGGGTDEAIPEDDEPEEKNLHPLVMPAALGMGAGYMGGVAARKYAQSHHGGQKMTSPDRGTKDRYSRLAAAHDSLVREHGRLAHRFEGLLREKSDAERRAAIQQLHSRYPDFVDVDAECKATLYSQKSTMDDPTFRSHLSQVERYAQRAEAVARSHRPDIPMGSVDRSIPEGQSDQYSARLAKEAVRIHTQAVNRGESMTYAEAKEKAQATLK